eukprot:TRINITY_DN20629_c0_g1_i1.p1 TRINITY_DN20629_c0_g1~~TRINITY_DN20629_c0_g1_i1.p1  ORF type:complete len:214 (+),score=42.53 TRINITY_DN20629_c0_g1_i1:1-642(+)
MLGLLTRVRASAVLYVLGTASLLPGTIFLLDRYASLYYSGINWLIAATSMLTAAALIDYVAAWCPPPAPEDPLLPSTDPSEVKKHPADRQLLIPHMMLQGGVLFLVASCMYLKAVASKPLLGTSVSNMGTWVFRVGTCSYLCGSFATFRGIVRSEKGVGGQAVLSFGVFCFIVGALLYLTGGILTQTHLKGFAETWIAGSVFFAAGAIAFFVA